MAAEWFYQLMGSQLGPVSGAELLALAQRGTITHDTLVRKGANGNWVSAQQVQGLPFAPCPADQASREPNRSSQIFDAVVMEVRDGKDVSRSAVCPTPVPDLRAPLVLRGRQGKSVVVQGSTVKIIKKARMFAAQRDKTFPIRNITSVEVKKPGPFIAGFIQFSIAGGQPRNSSYTLTGGAFDAAQDENSVVFNNDDEYRMALRIKSYIEQFAENNGNVAPTLPAAPAAFSVADEIAKLKRLADEGILTREEFEAKKKQLLGI